jgi:thiol-disulfide isomerase/thioredoxin
MGVVIVVSGGYFHAPLRDRIAGRATLLNDAPPPEDVEDMIQRAPDPARAVIAAWRSGKVVHRQVAIRHLAWIASNQAPTPELQAVLRAAALDADFHVREAAFAGLAAWDDPEIPALATAQTGDRDPEIQLLGLQYVRSVPAEMGVPAIMPLLDHADPFVVATALRQLERWSGQEFGVRLSDTVPVENLRTGRREFREGSEVLARVGADRARAWWQDHKGEFDASPPVVPGAVHLVRPMVAPDFSLENLDGRRIRLTDFRGKVVLINFWTTWCTACLPEMRALSDLRSRHSDNLEVFGVSLDMVPDSHGHLDTHPAVEERDLENANPSAATARSAVLQRLRDKVLRTVKARGITYPILLDPDNIAGGRYQGGELPTTVIVDARGYVRRRFVGARTLPVLEALVDEAMHPWNALDHSATMERKAVAGDR